MSAIKVTHIIFGKGKVVEEGDTFIKVAFKKSIGEKAFVYPDAFANFLTYDDKEQQKAVNDALAAKKAPSKTASNEKKAGITIAMGKRMSEIAFINAMKQNYGVINGSRMASAILQILKLEPTESDEILEEKAEKLVKEMKKGKPSGIIPPTEGKIGMQDYPPFVTKEEGIIKVHPAGLVPVFMWEGETYKWDKIDKEAIPVALKCFYNSSPDVQWFVRKRAWLEKEPSKQVLKPAEYFRKGDANEALRRDEKVNPWHGGLKEYGEYYKIRGEKIGGEDYEMRNELMMQDNLDKSMLLREIENIPEILKMDKASIKEILGIKIAGLDDMSHYTTKKNSKELPVLESWKTIPQKGYKETVVGKEHDYVSAFIGAFVNYLKSNRQGTNELITFINSIKPAAKEKQAADPKRNAFTIANAICYSDAVELFLELNGFGKEERRILLEYGCRIENGEVKGVGECREAYRNSMKAKELFALGRDVEGVIKETKGDVFEVGRQQLELDAIDLKLIEKVILSNNLGKYNHSLKKIARYYKDGLRLYLEHQQVEILKDLEEVNDEEKERKLREKNESISYKLEKLEEMELVTDIKEVI